MDVINAIEVLMLDRLDYDFIESVWDQEFMSDTTLPDEYLQIINFCNINVFNDIIEAVDKWQTEDDFAVDSDQKSWRELSELNLNHKALLIVLWYFIVKGQKNGSSIDTKYASLRAATLYLKLLTVSGSRVYHAFHPYLCLKTVSVLKYGLLAAPKGKKKFKKQIGEGTSANIFGTDSHLNEREIVSIVNELVITIEALKSFVNQFSLQSDPELLEEIIERLAEITRLEVNTPNFMAYHSANRSLVHIVLSGLACSAYETLKSLCKSQHGEIEDTIIIILKHLSPGVLADHELSFREQCIVRKHTVHFVKYLLSIFKDDAIRGVTILIHNIFTKIGDRAETRQKGKESIVDIMQDLPNEQYTNVVKWLFDCAHCDKASYRLLALEIMTQLLHDHEAPVHGNINMDSENAVRDLNNESSDDIDSEEDEHITQNTEMEEEEDDNLSRPNRPTPSTAQDIMLHKYMLAVIFARCRDSSANVRTKALGLLIQCMKSDNMVVRSLMNEIFVLNQQTENDAKGFLNYKQLSAALKKKSNLDPLPSAGMILSELKSLVCDSKVYVRKAALQTLENIMKVNRSWLTGNILKIMGLCCRDPAVSIRKEMVQILSDLLQRYPDDRELIKVWSKNVVPLVFDQEGKLQECVLKNMYKMIIDNLRQYDQQQDNIWSILPWQLLTHIVQFDLHVCLMKACEIWAKQKEISNSLVKNVCSHVGTENNLTAWIVLYCLSLHMEFRNPLFAVDYYRQALTSNQDSVSLLVIVLEVLLSCSAYLPHHVQEEMLEEMKSSLSNFGLEKELIRLNVEIALDLTYHLADSKEQAMTNIRSWAGELLEICQTYLEDTFQFEATKILDEEKFVCHLHTLGEIAIHNPRQIRSKTFHLLQRYLFLPERNSVGNLSCIPVAKPLTVVALGKLCLLNQLWAQEAIRPLVKLLNTTHDLPTLLNIIYVLRDLCVRYGVIMEPHLPSLWMCLKDAAVEVRFTVLTCLVELLQNSYIKFRGAMFFHILSMVCDTDENVVELATYFLHDFLVPAKKNIMLEHIIDALFHYNNYEGHKVYGKKILTREEQDKFLLKGEGLKEERLKIYAFMLENMDDESRMQTKSSLVTEVLDGIVEGQIRSDEVGENVILDAIRILNSKHISLRALQLEHDEDLPGENTEINVANILLKARNKTIAECEKKYMIERIVPVVIRFKAVLEEKHSKLISPLMEYLRDMMKDYKNEVKDIFAEDRKTACEILSSIVELERRQRRSENIETEQENICHRTSDEFPSGVRTLLENASPWVRQCIVPEIFRCYKIGGVELMLKYARNKLRRLEQKTRRLSKHDRPNSHSIFHASQDSVVEPKEEDYSENDDSREFGNGGGGSYDVRLGEQDHDSIETGEDCFEIGHASEEREEQEDKDCSEDCERREDLVIYTSSTSGRDEQNEEAMTEAITQGLEAGECMDTNYVNECERRNSEIGTMDESSDDMNVYEEHQQVDSLSVGNDREEQEKESAEESDDIEHYVNDSLNKNIELMEELSEVQRHKTETLLYQNKKRSGDSYNNKSKKLKSKHVSNTQGDVSQFYLCPINGNASTSKEMNNR